LARRRWNLKHQPDDGEDFPRRFPAAPLEGSNFGE
jgi:hypothetical protein